MTSLIKLKINHKAESGRNIPWDLIYLVKKEDLQICKRLFKYHLVVNDAERVKTLLNEIDFEDLVSHGMHRGDQVSERMMPMKQLKELVNLDDYSLLIPILSRGKKKGKKSLRYFSSKQFRRGIKDAETNRSFGYTFTPPVTPMPSVIICAGKDLEGYPCTNCANLHKKIIDNEACTLGSTECLSNIILGTGSDFNTAISKDKEAIL